MKEFWLDYRVNLIERREKREREKLRKLAKKKHIEEKIQERKDKYLKNKMKRCEKR